MRTLSNGVLLRFQTLLLAENDLKQVYLMLKQSKHVR